MRHGCEHDRHSIHLQHSCRVTAGDAVDTVTFEGKQYYRILGRTSVDIIKSGGFKISALHVESALLDHKFIDEAVAMGIQDITYGEVVACLLVISPGAEVDEAEVRRWASATLAPYEVPKVVRFVADIPKNAMGKVNKRALRQLHF
jgi:malonyl-CoA/methylmalonyl-CoA synthetase